MRLLIIRHAAAGDRAEWEAEGRDDRLRPITAEGKKQMRRAVAGLATLVSQIDVLAASPLLRAGQSAEIVAAEYGGEVATVPALEPKRDPEELLQWLKEQRKGGTIAVVGHEPHLGTLLVFLTTGKRDSFVDLKKAGVASLELAEPIKPGEAVLEWLLPPRILRELAE